MRSLVMGPASVQQIEAGTDEYQLYHALVRGSKTEKAIGKGEAAGIALAKTYEGILASNNYQDIGRYIEKYDLRYIDTGHILIEALTRGMITEDDANIIWQQMLNKNRKLPGNSFFDYLKSHKVPFIH